VDEEEHEQESGRVRAQRPAAAGGKQPHNERGERECRRPLDGCADTERGAGERPAFTVSQQQTGSEQRGGHEIEFELPEVGVGRPEGDDDGEPGAPACPQTPDRRDGQKLKRDHQEGVGDSGVAATQKGFEREQEDGASRVLRARVVAVEQGFPLKAEDD